MLYMLYLPTEIYRKVQQELRILRKLRELRKITIFVRFVASEYPGNLWLNRLNKNCEFYENRNFRETCS